MLNEKKIMFADESSTASGQVDILNLGSCVEARRRPSDGQRGSNMFKKMIMFAVIAGLVFALAPSADAAIIASEDFNDGSGNDDGLVYTQGSITIGETGANKGLESATHAINLTGTTNSGQYFVRALVKREAVTDKWGGVSFFAGSTEICHFGLRPISGTHARDYWGISDCGAGTDVDYAASSDSPNQVYLMVGMIDYDNDEAKLWIDPAIGSTAPTADGMTTDWTWGNNNPRVPTKVELRQDGSKPLDYDEIVVGESWGDVIPEPATVALIGLGGIGVLLRRRRA